MEHDQNTKPLSIALFGHGKMGTQIKAYAENLGHHITSPDKADVAIDFSHPDAILDHVHLAKEKGLQMVVGTTGWDEQRRDVENIVNNANIGLIFASNFSIGMQLFIRLAKSAATLFSPFEDYDVAGFEAHHKEKFDKPSGTAFSLEKALCQTSRWENVPFTSMRVGKTVGTHTIVFDSIADTITLNHTARSRAGFVKGALIAATWIMGKKGFYQIEDLIEEVLSCKAQSQH